jgi:hypothetical protein
LASFGQNDLWVHFAKIAVGFVGQNAFRPSSSRPSAARAGTHEHRPVIMGPRLRGDDRIFVSPNAPRTLVLILREGASRRLRMRLPKHERRAGWSDPCIFLFFCRHRSRVYPRSAPNVRKSGKPDLRGPFQSVTVPDQRCTASRCIASGTRDSNAGFLITDSLVKQPSSFPRPHCCVRALPLCFTHPR